MPDFGLIGDIGGTNARFALTDLSVSTPQVLHERTLDDTGFDGLQDAALHYLAEVDAKPTRAALAVASPVRGDEVRFTNRAWSFKRSELQKALGLDALHVINDFAAVAWSAPEISVDDRIVLHGDPGASLQAPVTLIGPGTGLGVALLLGSRDAGWNVVATEGGHACFAPGNGEEEKISHWIAARHGCVFNERLLSGDGLSNIDAALRDVKPVVAPVKQNDMRSAKDIVDAALLNNDADAKRALDSFCNAFGSVAGDAALMHGACTVMIAGGMVMHFLDHFRASGFMQRFVDKGSYTDYMQRIGVQIITHPNPGLLGAAVALRHFADNAPS